MLFPSRKIAENARIFILNYSPQTTHQPHIVQLSFPPVTPPRSGVSTPTSAVHLFVLLYTHNQAPLAKAFWQHTGLGISSRMAEYCLIQLGSVAHLDDPASESPHSNGWSKPLRRTPYKNRHYAKDVKFGKTSPPLPARKESVSETDALTVDQVNYLEERYGRNLDVSFAGRAKIALRRRIAGTLHENVDINEALLKEGPVGRSEGGIDEGDVYLLPTGMAAIWLAHQLLLQALPARKSVCFGYEQVLGGLT
jgi:cystathionine gamma-synthase